MSDETAGKPGLGLGIGPVGLIPAIDRTRRDSRHDARGGARPAAGAPEWGKLSC